MSRTLVQFLDNLPTPVYTVAGFLAASSLAIGVGFQTFDAIGESSARLAEVEGRFTGRRWGSWLLARAILLSMHGRGGGSDSRATDDLTKSLRSAQGWLYVYIGTLIAELAAFCSFWGTLQDALMAHPLAIDIIYPVVFTIVAISQGVIVYRARRRSRERVGATLRRAGRGFGIAIVWPLSLFVLLIMRFQTPEQRSDPVGVFDEHPDGKDAVDDSERQP